MDDTKVQCRRSAAFIIIFDTKSFLRRTAVLSTNSVSILYINIYIPWPDYCRSTNYEIAANNWHPDGVPRQMFTIQITMRHVIIWNIGSWLGINELVYKLKFKFISTKLILFYRFNWLYLRGCHTRMHCLVIPSTHMILGPCTKCFFLVGPIYKTMAQ